MDASGSGRDGSGSGFGIEGFSGSGAGSPSTTTVVVACTAPELLVAISVKIVLETGETLRLELPLTSREPGSISSWWYPDADQCNVVDSPRVMLAGNAEKLAIVGVDWLAGLVLLQPTNNTRAAKIDIKRDKGGLTARI